MVTLKKKLTVFSSARFPKLAESELRNFKNDVRTFISALCPHYHLVYGGGHVGLMGLVADTFLENQCRVTGVIPDYLNTHEIQHPHISDTQIVDDLHARKALMEKLADVYLVLPGGIGTLDELCEVLTLQSLNRHQKLICIWNWQNTFDAFFQFILDGIQNGFISEDILSGCVISENFPELLKKLL
jgi:uncharacterized protein (TIGR00730 family)